MIYVYIYITILGLKIPYLLIAHLFDSIVAVQRYERVICLTKNGSNKRGHNHRRNNYTFALRTNFSTHRLTL